MPCAMCNSGVTKKDWDIGSLCEGCYGICLKQLDKNLVVPIDVLDDFVKVYVLLQYNVPYCLAAIAKLEQEITGAKAIDIAHDQRFLKRTDDTPGYVKLSRVLEYYEGLCWFPANRSMLTNLLSSDGFNESLCLGFNKDPGAGIAHGQQTHRVQWHVIMRAMTNDFSSFPYKTSGGWHNSPLQLFYEFTQGVGKVINAWSIILDSQGNNGWGNPDRVVIDINASGNVQIRDAFVKRAAKMDSIYSHGMDATVEAAIAHGLRSGKNPMSIASDAALEAYKFHKTKKVRSFRDSSLSSIDHRQKRNYQNETREFGRVAAGRQGWVNNKDYVEIEENLLVKRERRKRLQYIDSKLVIKSLSKHANPLYQYNAGIGASPTALDLW